MIFDGFVRQLPDTDPSETEEWLDSLDAVVDAHGKTRARFLIAKLMDRAAQLGVGVPATVSTPYVNTIPVDQQAWFPGDEDIERRIRAYIRWNAAVMVVRANKHSEGIGGHLATFASSAALYEVGFNHFFRGKEDGLPGDQVYFQGHAAPGIYARAFLEGRLDESQLDGFRQEVSGGGLSSYPHPRLMPDFWEFPTVSMGLGPDQCHLPGAVQPLPAQPSHRRYQQLAGVVLHGRRRGRRARVARRPDPAGPGAPRQPDLRRELQPAAPRRPGAGQREDHPGARSRVPGGGLERAEGGVGLEVGRAPGQGQGRRPAQQDEHDPRRGVPEVLGRIGSLHPGALLRARPAPAADGREHDRRRVAEPAPRRPRLPQALCRLQGGGRARERSDRDPGQDDQGLDARPRRRGPQRHPPDQEAGGAGHQAVPGPPLHAGGGS